MLKTNDVFLFNPRRSLRWMKLERQGNQSYTEKLEECKDITGMCVKDELRIHYSYNANDSQYQLLY